MVTVRNPEKSREIIMEAARRQIHRHGFRAASLNLILDSTGLTKGAIYHHFSNKQALGYAVVEEVLGEIVEENWIKPLNRAENPIDCIMEICSGFSSRVEAEFALLGCPLNNLAVEMSCDDEGFRTRIGRIYENWQKALIKAFNRGLEKGQVRPGVNPEAASAVIVAGISGIWSMVKASRDQAMLKNGLTGLADYLDSLRA